jgi:hypothetical protein
MEQQVNYVSRSCNAQLWQISHIRKYLTTDTTKCLVNSRVTSRLDYCNALLIGVSNTVLLKFQRVQNAAARLISLTSRFDHITPKLRELHWLPVHYRTRYKILIYIYKTLHDGCPIYIKRLLEIYKPTRNLRSKNQSDTLVIPKS